MLVEPVEALKISSVLQLLCLSGERTQLIPSYLLFLYFGQLSLQTFIFIAKLIKQYLVFLLLCGQPRDLLPVHSFYILWVFQFILTKVFILSIYQIRWQPIRGILRGAHTIF